MPINIELQHSKMALLSFWYGTFDVDGTVLTYIDNTIQLLHLTKRLSLLETTYECDVSRIQPKC